MVISALIDKGSSAQQPWRQIRTFGGEEQTVALTTWGAQDGLRQGLSKHNEQQNCDDGAGDQ